MLGHDVCEIVDLFLGELGDTKIINGDVVLISSNDAEGIVELLLRDGIEGNTDHVIGELIERDGVTTIRHAFEQGLENGITTFKIEFDKTQTRKRSLEIETGELASLLRIEMVEGFFELLQLFGGDVARLGCGLDLAFQKADLFQVGLDQLAVFEIQVVISVFRVLIIFNVGVDGALFGLLDGGQS